MENILGLDFDGVICNSAPAKRNWLKNYGIDISSIDDCSMTRSTLTRIIGIDSYLRMQSEVGYEDTMYCDPIPGSLEGIRTLSDSWAVIIVTARNSSKLEWVHKWLQDKSIHDSIKHTYSSEWKAKLKVASQASCSTFVDNDIRHLVQAKTFKIRALLFGRSQYLLSSALRIDSVNDWDDLLYRLTNGHP